MSDSLIANMRQRAELCRRLAKSTTDQKIAKILSDMADEVEADIKRLQEAVCGETPDEPSSSID